MKYSQFSNKVAVGLGFTSLHDMDKSDADLDLCWGNGFDSDRVFQLFSEVVFGNVVDRDADQLTYYFCQTSEGFKKMLELVKTFGGAEGIANSLIRGLDYRLFNASTEVDRTAKIHRCFLALSSITDGEVIPFTNYEKPNYITDPGIWGIIADQARDVPEILRCLTAEQLGAARYFIESKTGSFIDELSMESWTFPGYIHTKMQIPQQIEIFRFVSTHLGEREAFVKLVDPNTFGDSVSPFIKELAKSGDLRHWKEVFRIADCAEFLNNNTNRAIPTFIQDLVASSISSSRSDIEQLQGLKKSALTRLVSRGCMNDKSAMLMAGNNKRLKGKILENSLGM